MKFDSTIRQEINPNMDHEEIISMAKRELVNDLVGKILEEYEDKIQVLIEQHDPTYMHNVINMKLELDVEEYRGYSIGGFVEHGNGYSITIDNFINDEFVCKI